MCRDKNIGRRFDKINGKCKNQFAGSPKGIAIYKKSIRKKRRQYFKQALLKQDVNTLKK